MRRLVVCSLALLALVGADRLTKLYMMNPARGGFSFVPGALGTVNHHNFGIIANVPVPQYLIILTSLIVIALIVIGLHRAMRQTTSGETIALLVLLAGAIGNLWDRWQYGYVFDWLLLLGRSAINLADIFIAVGLVWYLIEQSRTLPAHNPL